MTDACDERGIIALLTESRELPHGPAKVACIERATRFADAIGDTQLAFMAREALIEAAEFSGAPQKTLDAFAWCLAQCDRQPREFPVTRILWQYKWAADNVYLFPNMSRDDISRTLDDVERRFRAKRWGIRAPRKLRLVVAMGMGDREAARAHYRAWSATRRDTGSDCPACDQQAKTRFFQLMNDHKRAIRAAEPLLDGRLECAEEPHHTTCLAIRSFHRLGRLGEAVECYERTRRRLRPTSSLYGELAIHIEFLTLTSNFRRAVGLLERHLAGALATWDFEMKFKFLVAALLLIRALRRTRDGSMRLRLAGATPISRPDGVVNLAEAEAWLEGECRVIADAFDRRNGNSHYSSLVDEVPDLLALQQTVELP
ncbi:MAG: hypothetical protein IT450_20895 [Phycisphaerales bacterium]|nr:hypothetical protein [Phycisphaerales bacterium]